MPQVPQSMVPPQPFGAVPHSWPAGQDVAGSQTQWLGVAMVSQRWAMPQSPHRICPPQPSGAVPQFCPFGQAVIGVQLHIPHEQEVLQVCIPGPVMHMRVIPGAQTPSFMHAPNSPNMPVAWLQTRVCVPQLPQARVGDPMHSLGAWQFPPAQTRLPEQSALVVHGVHTPSPRQSWGLQVIAAPAVQRALTQVLGTRLSPLQLAPQAVPAGAPSAQRPPPSQVPVFPHTGLVGSRGQPPPAGAVPAPRGEQVPEPQLSHAPPQAVLQQTLFFEQTRPERQSVPSWQGPPAPDCPHLPPRQGTPTHWLSAWQLARQRGPVGSQAKPPQERAAGTRHMPVPVQVPMSVTLPLVQRASEHLRPAAYWRQAPRPLQVPSLPQLFGSVARQVLEGSRPPAGTEPQIPIELGSLHC
jgi:hypothetical protein